MAMARGDVNSIIKNVLFGHLATIEKASERDALVVYGPIVHGLDRMVNDAIESIEKRQEKLILVLNTGGGIAEVVERIVDSMRYRYQDIAVVVPDRAMSSGTILCMACDSILMDNFSRLGPIDPQVLRNGKFVPARSYLVQFQRMIAKDQAGQLSAPEVMLIQKLDLAELHEFEQAEELSKTLLRKWLAKYKFKDWTVTETTNTPVTDVLREKRAEEIAGQLNDNTRWHSHGRGIGRETLEKELKLKIDRLEEKPDLANAVHLYHDALVDYMQMSELPIFVHTRDHY